MAGDVPPVQRHRQSTTATPGGVLCDTLGRKERAMTNGRDRVGNTGAGGNP